MTLSKDAFGILCVIAINVASATAVFASEEGQQRVIEESLVYKDPTVSSSGNWVFGIAAEEFYVNGQAIVPSSSGDGSLETGTVSASKPGINFFAGYGDVTLNYVYRSGNENLNLFHNSSALEPLSGSHTVALSQKENEIDVRWRLSSLDTDWFSPYVYAGYIDVKSDNTDTLQGFGQVWTATGTPTRTSTNEWKGYMAGAGAIIPVSENYGFRIDAGLIGTSATYILSNGTPVIGSGIGGRATGTIYYNIAQGWNAQAGWRLQYLNGGNAGSTSPSGVFAMLGYSFK